MHAVGWLFYLKASGPYFLCNQRKCPFPQALDLSNNSLTGALPSYWGNGCQNIRCKHHEQITLSKKLAYI